jgi:nucleoside-diphosphate-sugar epimerase
MSDTRVLVTGGSGFVAGHAISRLLDDGYQVRATLRSLNREAAVRETLHAHDRAQLSFFAADLSSDEGWSAAVEGCNYVLHVASPFPPAKPKDENDVIVPAVEGTLRVLRAATNARVRRVVVTSSFAAIGYSPKASGLPYDESDWTDPEGQAPYVKSKTLSERAAWDFAAAHPDGPELAVVNPVGVFGPVLGPDISSSIAIIKSLLDGAIPVLPRASFAVVDVRDVADLHVRAMTDPAAAGQRFLAAAGQPMSMPQIAATLRSQLGQAAHRVPTREVPDWLVRAAARVVPPLGELADLLGPPKAMSIAKATEMLGWQPRSTQDAIIATGESLTAGGLQIRPSARGQQ